MQLGGPSLPRWPRRTTPSSLGEAGEAGGGVALAAATGRLRGDDLPVIVPAVRLCFVVAAFGQLTTGHLAARDADRERLRQDLRPPRRRRWAGRCATPGHGRGVLPDPTCTPTNPDVTQASIGSTICRGGYTATIRPPAAYTSVLKRQQIVAYRYPDTSPSDYERTTSSR